jgi:hypothetical protein
MALGMAMSIAGCDLTKEGAIEKGKEMVASTLKDPDSAKFQGVFMVDENTIGDTHYGVLCGAVNSRNSFGGFTGFRRFVANFHYSKRGQLGISYVTLEEGGKADISSDGASYFHNIYWLGKCEPRPSASAPVVVAALESKESPKSSPIKPKPLKPATIELASAPSKLSGWAVQIASMSDATKAGILQRKIARGGFSAYITTKDGRSRVFVGPFSDRLEAESQAEDLRSKQHLNGFVVRVEK